MVGPSNLKALQYPLQVFSVKLPSSSSSSTSSSMELKNLVHTLIFSHVCRFIRALSKAKSKALSILIHLLRENQPMRLIYTTRKNKKKNKNAKMFFGSFRLHYNWCSSSHVMPVAAPVYDGLSVTHSYYDSSWNSEVSTEHSQYFEDCPESQLSGYLQWLEDKKVHDESDDAAVDVNEIDRLADLFIASCHEKFILEKQESYRRFQEMLARSM
ncbi:hypothetical protein FNV43_RR16547 [Rhamnella rubrinervis]|uniref:DUF761 domain-containing protein n=1 Tax=Rhamnella rubrinervis TaxID=2594499 RepID=A0A8K0GZ14_9ROSA|nr:hypothetical protein FNV43_RR16547 [Rhamnella rubrinervis]